MQIPKHVVQAGEVDPCHKIYIEDYVHTFLTQYRADSADFCLYGKSAQEEGISYYFIYGAVKEEAGWEMMKSRYFAGSKSLGEASCDKEEIWLFFEDGYATSLDGYFIFYEQNEDMQSYLIAMHQNQPGEKTVEVRPRAAGTRVVNRPQPTDDAKQGTGRQTDIRRLEEAYMRIKTPERGLTGREGGRKPEEPREGQAKPELQPRRIRRTPLAYDLKQKEESREKVMHAAQLRAGKKGQKSPIPFSGRAASLTLLLVLCVIGIGSINGYQDMKEVGNFFAQTVRGLGGDGESREEQTPDDAKDGEQEGFVIEEKQLSLVEPTSPDQAFPVFAPVETDAKEDISKEQDKEAQEETEAGDVTPERTQQETTEGQPVASEPMEENQQIQEGTAETGNVSEEETAAPIQEAVASAGPVSYTVQKGDSIAIICRRQYGNTDRVAEVISLNDLPDPNHLEPGQKIWLPD